VLSRYLLLKPCRLYCCGLTHVSALAWRCFVFLALVFSIRVPPIPLFVTTPQLHSARLFAPPTPLSPRHAVSRRWKLP